MLGLMWWSWVGYAWLTSVVDPEEGAVRFAIFAAMAGLLIVSLCIPHAFGDSRAAVRLRLRRRPDTGRSPCSRSPAATTRRCATRSSASPAARPSASGLVIAGALFESDTTQVILWSVAMLLDVGEPYLFGSEGWQLEPGHFAERHGLIIIIALGESIVAIGVGAEHARRHRRGGRPRSSGSPWRAPSGGSTSTSSRWSPSGGSSTRRSGASRTRSPATPSPTSTSRWSPASCWSRSG